MWSLFVLYSKGISQSALPYRRTVPNVSSVHAVWLARWTHTHTSLLSCTQWLKSSPEEVKEHIYKLAKKGLTPSQIGRLDMTPSTDCHTRMLVCSIDLCLCPSHHNRCDSEGQPWCGASQAHHGKQNFEDSEGKRSAPSHILGRQ